jgi:hypothetical protein
MCKVHIILNAGNEAQKQIIYMSGEMKYCETETLHAKKKKKFKHSGC